MQAVTALASDEHDALIVRFLRERANLLCVALTAGVRHEEKTLTLSAYTFDVLIHHCVFAELVSLFRRFWLLSGRGGWW